MGAVITIARTTIANTVPPQERPIDKAVPPIEACTVAFDKYAKTQNAFSLAFIPQPRTQNKTPTDLDSRPTLNIKFPLIERGSSRFLLINN